MKVHYVDMGTLCLQAFHLPLALKYGCPAQSTWMLTIHSLLNVLAVGLPIAAKHGKGAL